MFRRPESLRERTLLRIITQQQQTIADLNDRLMALAGQPWAVPPVEMREDEPTEEEEPLWSALDQYPEGANVG